MKDILNARIKHREPFRPFAPVVLAEATGEYFEKDYPSPFMLHGLQDPRREARADPGRHARRRHGPAADRRARQNPRYYRLIEAFGA